MTGAGEASGTNAAAGAAREPKVSIIVTTFNYGKYLGDAISSALAQTWKNTEILVVDDGSTDDSVIRAKEYGVKVFTQQNMGVGAARNNGAHFAEGEFLVFLDADDLLDPLYVEKCLKKLLAEKETVAYTYTQMEYFGEKSGIFPSKEFSREGFKRDNFVNASAMIRKRVFDEAGGFDRNMRIGCEDWELFVRLLKRGFTGVLVAEPLLKYRKHGISRNALGSEKQLYIKCLMNFLYPDIVEEPGRYKWWKISKSRIRSYFNKIHDKKKKIYETLRSEPPARAHGPTPDRLPTRIA